MRNYKKVVGSKKKRYRDFTQQSLSNAVQSVKEGMKIREAANLYGIPKSTSHRKVRGLQTKSHGGQTCLTTEEKSIIVNNCCGASERSSSLICSVSSQKVNF